MKNLFHWNVTKETGVVILCGLIMIGLSVLMIPFGGNDTASRIAYLVLRNVLMIFGLGFCFVTLYAKRRGNSYWQELGFNKHKLKLSMVLNVVLSLMLVAVFIKEGTNGSAVTVDNIYGAVYVMVAGIFEMMFIYGFLRNGFEKAFGMIPSIILTAVFYSFHHAGFQPEFIELFFVGIMYCGVFYIARNMLIIFPFFWAVGAVWDVLFDSSSGDRVKNLFSFILALAILLCMCIWMIILKRGNGNNAVKDIDSHNGTSLQGEA